MKLRKVDPSTIVVPEVRVTSQFDDETREMLRKNLEADGQLAPIICSEVDGQIVLVDGLHRLQDLIALGHKTVDVALVPGDMVDVLTRNLLMDHLRGKHPVSEMVKVIQTLWKEYRLDSDAIAAKTGMTRDYVEKLQLISELTPMCLEALNQGMIKMGHAAALTRIKDPVKQETILQQQLLYRWPVKELEDYIKDVLATIEAPPEPQAPAEERKPIRIKCTYCGEEFEPAEIANPNTCRGCSGVIFASMSQARQEARQTAPRPEDGV
ncbi:MAG: ParB/RepB/Spo0J family partition protein [Chloroflexi bacterium]|nr:ParB/RepB/Spo0J family partition protein [Chloroflexota bacterium]